MSELLGQKLLDSVDVSQHIDAVVQQVRKLSEKIDGPRDPQPDHIESSKKAIDHAGKVRGRPLFYPYLGSGIGRGPYVELIDGSVKLDLINGIGIHLLGHSHPEVIRACLEGSLADIVVQGNLQPNQDYVRFSEKLLGIASKGSRLRHCWLATCGSMANENALKACRQKMNGARKIIAMDSAFAGRSTMMAEITDNPGFREGLPTYNEVLRIPFYDKKDPQSTEKSVKKLKQHIAENAGQIGVFTFEPMQGEGGYKVAPREFFLPLLQTCRESKIPVWIDEVQTFTRTGEFFAFQTLNFGDYADVVTIAKTAQNGATLFTEELNPKPGLIAGTFSGSSPALKAGLKIFEIMETQGYYGPKGKVAAINKEFLAMLNELNSTTCKGLLQDSEGLGLMCAVTPLDGSKEKVGKLLGVLFKNGLVAFNCGHGPVRLRFLIPAVMTSKDIQVAKKIIEKSILECV